MIITVNKKHVELAETTVVANLIKKLNYHGTVAVFINGNQLLLSQYSDYMLSEGDKVIIIKPLGGG